MPELKKFAVFGENGQIGTLEAATRFLDSRAERTIQMEDGREVSVPADALTVRPDGSFLLREIPQVQNGLAAEPRHEAETNGRPVEAAVESRMFREGYSIERVQVDRIVAEAPQQRQEGDTLVLPVVEEVLVTEKRLMLREEIRITRRREPVENVRTVSSSLQ